VSDTDHKLVQYIVKHHPKARAFATRRTNGCGFGWGADPNGDDYVHEIKAKIDVSKAWGDWCKDRTYNHERLGKAILAALGAQPEAKPKRVLARWIAENNPYAYEFAKNRLQGHSFNFDGPANATKIGCKLNEQPLRGEWDERVKGSTAYDETKKLGQEILDELATINDLPVEAIEFIEDEWLPYLRDNPKHAQEVLKGFWAVYEPERYASLGVQKQHSAIHYDTPINPDKQSAYIEKRLAFLKPVEPPKPDSVAAYEAFIRDTWWPYLRDNPEELKGVLTQPRCINFSLRRYEDEKMRGEERKLFDAVNNEDKARKIRNDLLHALNEQEKRNQTRLDQAVDAMRNYMVTADLAKAKLTTYATLDDTDTGRLWSRETIESFTNPTTTNEEPAMSNPTITFTTTKFITVGNGQKRDISQVSLDELFSLIEQTEAEIARLEAIKKKPKALQARIEALQAAIDELAAEADSR
jgi:hypothetical protein